MSVNVDLHQALRPGGRLYILDFEPIEGLSAAQRLAHVRASKEVVIEEIEGAAFVLVREIAVDGLEKHTGEPR